MKSARECREVDVMTGGTTHWAGLPRPSALWLIGRSGALAGLASPEHDRGALELDVRAATALGKGRAKASASARLSRLSARQGPQSKPVSG